MFPLWLRLWRLFHRKEPADAQWLATAMDERMELLKFRVLFGWVDTLAQARRMQTWAAERNVDLGSACDCGDFFDRRTLRLKTENLPGKPGLVLRALPIFLATALFLGTALVALTTHDGVFVLKATHRTLSVTATTVRPFSKATWVALNASDCAATDDPGELGVDRTAACEILGSKRLSQRIDDTVRAQREVGALALFYALLLGVPGWRYIAAVRAAYALRRELERNGEDDDSDVPGGQGERPLPSALVPVAA